MDISLNPSLRHLRALSALRKLSQALNVSNNRTLPTCQAEWLRDHVGIANIGRYQAFGNDDLGVCGP